MGRAQSLSLDEDVFLRKVSPFEEAIPSVVSAVVSDVTVLGIAILAQKCFSQRLLLGVRKRILIRGDRPLSARRERYYRQRDVEDPMRR